MVPDSIKPWGKIAIGVRMARAADSSFFASWTHLLAGGVLRKGDHVMQPCVGLPHHMAANAVADTFLDSDAATLLFIDDDMVFDKAALSTLRDDEAGWGFDILTALYTSRHGSFMPVVLSLDDAGEYHVEIDRICGKPVSVDSAGLGFTMIRREVFAGMRPDKPGFYFQWSTVEGEDTYFCSRAREIGARIGCHTGVSVGHRVTLTAYWDQEQGKAVIK